MWTKLWVSSLSASVCICSIYDKVWVTSWLQPEKRQSQWKHPAELYKNSLLFKKIKYRSVTASPPSLHSRWYQRPTARRWSSLSFTSLTRPRRHAAIPELPVTFFKIRFSFSSFSSKLSTTQRQHVAKRAVWACLRNEAIVPWWKCQADFNICKNMKKGVKLWSTCEASALVIVKLKSNDIMWQKRKSYPCLKRTHTVAESVYPTLKQTFNLETREGNMFLPFDRSCRWPDFVWICHSPPALPFYLSTQHSSFHLLSLHVSPAPSFILPSSISFFSYSCVIPSIHSALPRGVRGWLPVLTASYLTFSPLLWSNRQPSHTKSYRFTSPRADSSTSGRGWLNLQTSGHNGSVHPAV